MTLYMLMKLKLQIRKEKYMSSLYEIDERLRNLEEYGVDEYGEILDEDSFNAKFDEIQMALSEKIENSMCFYKNLQADIEAFKAEEKNLAQRRKVKENLAERVKNRIDNYVTMQFTDEDGNVDKDNLNKWKFETPKVKLSYRKSDSVEVSDINLLPKEYVKEKVELSADKTALKKDIKSGKEINGAKIVTNLNMQVK